MSYYQKKKIRSCLLLFSSALPEQQNQNFPSLNYLNFWSWHCNIRQVIVLVPQATKKRSTVCSISRASKLLLRAPCPSHPTTSLWSFPNNPTPFQFLRMRGHTGRGTLRGQLALELTRAKSVQILVKLQNAIESITTFVLQGFHSHP